MGVLRRIALGLLLAWAGSSLPVVAQDDFDPTTPPEPSTRYKVKVEASEAGIASTSGTGTYTAGTQVWINTSAWSTSYTFSHWLKDGVQYSTSQGFYYTVDAAAKFVAVYDFTPTEPAEPSGSYPRKLYLESSEEDACSFNRTSGAKVEENSYVNVIVYPNQGFEFKGWYENGTKVSSNTSFNYYMRNADATLTAMFEYNPTTPDEPDMAEEQGSVANAKLGDIDGNGTVNISDAVDLIEHYINGTTDELDASVADVDGNGTINVSDAIEIIDIYINDR